MLVSLNPKHHHLHILESWSPQQNHPVVGHKLGSWPLTTKQVFCFRHRKMFDYHHED